MSTGAKPRNTARESIKNMTAGSLATIIAKAVCQPLDVVKVRIQVYPTRYTSPLKVGYQLLKEQGILSLWKGHMANQSTSVAQGATMFLFYEELYYSFNIPALEVRPNLKTFVCGSLTGMMGVVFTAPLELIKTRLMADDNIKQIGTMRAGIRIFRREGIAGLYRGCFTSVLQVGPLLGARFMTYNFLCKKELNYYGVTRKEELPSAILLVNGAVAGFNSIIITQPLDVLKRRMQMRGFQGKGTEITSCEKIGSCILMTYRNEGLYGFYRGMATNIVKSALITAITFSCYDKIKLFFNKLEGLST